MSDLSIALLQRTAVQKLDTTENSYHIKIDIIRAITLSNGTASTRSIADQCNMSIYSARRWLMILEEKGILMSSHKNKSIEWSL